MSITRTLVAASLLLTTQYVFADAKLDEQMKSLALNSGCFICHHIETGSKGPNGMAPIGPNWEDVAQKYKGQTGVREALVRAVMQGSNAYSSHWKDKVSGLAMPPNDVAISQANTEKLVDWILSLK
jgi:cytochrome c